MARASAIRWHYPPIVDAGSLTSPSTKPSDPVSGRGSQVDADKGGSGPEPPIAVIVPVMMESLGATRGDWSSLWSTRVVMMLSAIDASGAYPWSVLISWRNQAIPAGVPDKDGIPVNPGP